MRGVQSQSCFVIFTPQQCLPPHRPPPSATIDTVHTHVRSAAYAHTHIVTRTTTAATVHIQPQKQDGCVGFVALLRFFDCMLSLFFFLPCHILIFSSGEERRALRAQG